MASVSDKTMVNEEQKSERIVLQGYHKKLKTMKKKYFVLYEEDGNSSARLEYFDNEKKFKSNSNSKRTIVLSDCFNINRRVDPKHEFVITLSNKDGCFGIVMEKEEDINTWLKAMLKLQSDQNKFLNPPKIFYEHVWQVVVQRKGLAESKGILGRYHVCLSPKSVTFIRIGNERTNTGEKRVTNIEFYLTSIRRCGDSKCYFYLEVGRQSVVGAGELWMETKDSLIAQNMHTMILNVMSSNAEDSYGPMRKRSSSATESTKPVTIQRRPTLNFSPLSGATNRGRCDSLPSSRNRTAPESVYNTFSNSSVPPSKTMSSLYSAPNSISYRPSVDNYAFVSSSMGFSESDGSTISIDEPDSAKICHTSIENTAYVTSFQNSCSPSGEVIFEENCDEFWSSGNKTDEFDKSASVLDTSNIQKNTTQNEDDGKLLSSCSNIYSADSESQYMNMFDSSLIRESATYDNTIAETELTSKLSYQSSGGNSRASSVTEETFDYVQMSPQTLTDYVDMEQSLKNKRQVGLPSNRNIMPEMPFKNMCFTNYALKKVNSGILADDDETQLKNQRPLRTYSVGSRMEHNNQKLRIELMTNVDRNNCRVRAFSVGSKSKIPKCDLQRNVLKMANSAKPNNSNFSNSKVSITNMEPIIQSTADRKSSSAPHLIHKIQNSADRMGDHMEIDFSKNSDSRSNSFSLHPEPPTTRLTKISKESGLVNNAPAGQNVISKKSNEAITSAEENGYLEMRPIIYNEDFSNTEKNVTNLVSNNIESRHQSQDSRNNKIIVEEKDRLGTPDGYLEMSWNGNKDYPVLHQNTSNYTNLVDDNFNISIKAQTQPFLSNMKNLKTLNKMTPVTTSHQYSSTGNSSNFLPRNEVTPKSELNQNKSFSRHNNSSYTISEEKTTGIEHINLLEKFNDLLISRKLPRRNTEDLPNVYVDLSSIDSDCYKYINFDPKISEQINSPKAVKENIFDTKAAKDDNVKDHLLDESKKITRKSNYNITPSKHLSLTNCQSLGNKNQPTNNSGYELLHISSDSSLQGKTFQCLSKSRSAKNNKHFALDSDTFQINSANNDIFQHKHVSPASTPRFHPLMIQLSCDNSAQDRLLAKENSSTSESTVYDKSQSPMGKEFKLHYASLDLPATSTTHAPTKCSSFDVTSKCLSPDAKAVQQSALEYAKIDFKQCEIQQCKMGE